MAIGKRTKAIREGVDPAKAYSLNEAVKMVKERAKAKFDETIEIAMNLGVDPTHADQMVRGVVTLPNGTGRTLRVGVFARGAKADEAKAAGADVVVSHLHAPATALLVKQAAEMGLGLPIVAGSAMATPSTAALVDPAALAGVCAESASAPILPTTAEGERFLAAYRKAFGGEPDTYALAQYDGVMMVLEAIAAGARTPAAVREALAAGRYPGIAMTYRSDGAGNMAHSAVILCYDGTSRTPRIAKRYDDIVALK